MLCARTRAVGLHGCRTRASAGGGRGAAGTGGHHGYNSSNTQVIGSHHIHFLRTGLSSFALVLLLFLVPRYAYAVPSLEVDGNFAGYEDGEEYKGYVVVDSPDNYQSTLCLIGEWSKLPQITTEQYETLSNPSTGGAFYELSQAWKKLGSNASGTEEYYPQWLALSEDFANGLVTVYGYGKVWAAVATDEQIEQAKQDFNTIIGGGSIGGGSGGSTITDSFEFSMADYIGKANPTWKNQQDIYETCNLSGTVTLTTAAKNWIQSHDNYEHIYIYMWRNNGAAYNRGLSYWIEATNVEYTKTAQQIIFNNAVEFGSCDTSYTTVNGYNQLNSSGGYGYSGEGSHSYYYYDTMAWLIDGANAGGTPEPEPSPDPWEPPTPSPDPPTNPTMPTPKDPITPDPPSLPGAPSDPVQPAPPQSPTVGDGGTFTVDIQGILDALDEHCIHIQTCLNANFSGQNSYLGQLFSTYTAAIVDQIYEGDVSMIGAIGDLQNTVTQGFNDILSYWDDYTEWLDKKLDFKWPETDTYDDADLLNWLRKIWARQGTGDVNTRPVDPATNYGGMSKWLGVLYGEIAGDVSDTSLTALSSSLSALQHTFPFSLPWDIQQILQALDATPATPAASITVPALTGAWDAYSYDIDLHWMDTSMVAVRGFELLAFVLYCLVHTKDVFGYVVGD